MDWFSDPGYWPSRWVFQRGLGLVYLVAFLTAANQFRALIGEHGLTPAPRFLRGRTLRQVPSLFTLRYSDRRFAIVAWFGVALSLGALVGLWDRLPLPVCMAMWALLWVLYLSIVNIGQIWYGFGWESLLLEVGFLAIFLGPAATEPPVLVLWLLRWVLFRVEFGAGLIKIRGDPCWRNLTCLYYHHETQPMPNPLSWYFHHLPKPLHRVEAAGNHVVQLVVPFGLFAPQPVAGVAAALMVATQLWLCVSGNFAWLNAITIVLGLSVIPGSWYAALPVSAPDLGAPPHWFIALTVALTAFVAVLSYRPVRNLLSSHQAMNASFDKLHLVNTYGAFGRVTRTRFEVVIEGCYDGTHGTEPEWKQYPFKGKPVDPQRRPRQFAPYHLRLDWLMWFAALSPEYARGWLPILADRLLDNDKTTLKLLRGNPFPGRPPDRVRAVLYEYHFTDRAERRRTGAWWTRERIGIYLMPRRASR
ncbi:lipase maturation factor family protein [Aldersonia sp. NBC_00410]|uniref:lipase maturation factor family protein n=1 Tax=Aldersonia sp. NBC_00410 TaxID=2975954 RepID=UPI00224F1A8D|nr:lipase maturation factor family protein [Aldersonia sp. NBC_00410]MCX5043093.1 lipase maturation factor family protein [Aldersonia sp. NBC_00410]